MTRADLQAIADGKTPITKRLTMRLTDCLLDVLKELDRMDVGDGMACDTCGARSGNSFSLGFKTRGRVIGAKILATELHPAEPVAS